MKTILTLVLASALLSGAAVVAQTRSVADLLHEALQVEEVKGDLTSAIATYRFILERHASDRPVAAQAQLRLAICYEALQRPDAAEAFEAVIKNYPDQPSVVAEARKRQASLARRSATENTALVERQQVWTGNDVDLQGLP